MLVLDGLVEVLVVEGNVRSVSCVIVSYTGLAEEWTLSGPEEIFVVGYDLNGIGCFV